MRMSQSEKAHGKASKGVTKSTRIKGKVVISARTERWMHLGAELYDPAIRLRKSQQKLKREGEDTYSEFFSRSVCIAASFSPSRILTNGL
jgi:hypothetical protein